MSGVETVQLYIRDVVGSVVRPVKELKGFDRVFLKPGESREVVFNISEKDLAFYHVDGTCRAEAGEFVVFIGSDSKTNNQATFSLVTS